MTENNIKWYVLRVRPRHEKAIAQRLAEKYEVFLPLYTKISQWSDRIKKIETPLFSGYLFIHTHINQKFFILEEQGVSSFVQFAGKPAILHECEINAIQLMLEHAAILKVEDGYTFTKGESIKITRGVFAGVIGSVENIKNKTRLFVKIEQLGKILSVEIDHTCIEKA
jgi:transcription antitermination factor NusG